MLAAIASSCGLQPLPAHGDDRAHDDGNRHIGRGGIVSDSSDESDFRPLMRVVRMEGFPRESSIPWQGNQGPSRRIALNATNPDETWTSCLPDRLTLWGNGHGSLLPSSPDRNFAELRPIFLTPLRPVLRPSGFGGLRGVVPLRGTKIALFPWGKRAYAMNASN